MITVWGQPDCGPCKLAVGKLDREGVAYQYKDITAPENAAKYNEFTTAGHNKSPIIEGPSETFAGLDPDKLQAAVDEAHAASETVTAAPDMAMDQAGPAAA